MSWRNLGDAASDADSGACDHIPKSPRFRSARNVAVLGSKEPRQVLTFLNGFLWEYGHRLRCRLKAEKAGLRQIPLYSYCQNCEKNTKTFPLTRPFCFHTLFYSYMLFCSEFLISRFLQNASPYYSAIY